MGLAMGTAGRRHHAIEPLALTLSQLLQAGLLLGREQQRDIRMHAVQDEPGLIKSLIAVLAQILAGAE